MQARWIAVAVFYAGLIAAAAQPSSKTPDLAVIAASLVILLVLSACRAVEWVRNGRLTPSKGLLAWYWRFVTDERSERRG
jgi:hypothetical protein